MLLIVLLLKPVFSAKSVAVNGPLCVISSIISQIITAQWVAFSAGQYLPTNDMKFAMNRQLRDSVLIRNRLDCRVKGAEPC